MVTVIKNREYRKKSNKIMGAEPTLSINTLNVNGLN